MPTNLDRYERIAPLYDWLDLPFEYGCYRRIRPIVFQGLSGRLLDAGVGTGRNFSFYPTDCHVDLKLAWSFSIPGTWLTILLSS